MKRTLEESSVQEDTSPDEQRQSILDISAIKLKYFQQCIEPSLLKSVLVSNMVKSCMDDDFRFIISSYGTNSRQFQHRALHHDLYIKPYLLDTSSILTSSTLDRRDGGAADFACINKHTPSGPSNISVDDLLSEISWSELDILGGAPTDVSSCNLSSGRQRHPNIINQWISSNVETGQKSLSQDLDYIMEMLASS